LLDDATIFEIVDKKLPAILQGKGIVFDGMPRRFAQADHLMNMMKVAGKERVATVFLSLPHGESLKRLVRRAEIEGRVDDTKERIEFRLEQYEKETVPVLDYLKKTTRFFEIDGTPPPAGVTQEIAKALGIALA